MVKGNTYKFTHDDQELVYIHKEGNWHQFRKAGEVKVWCELMDTDLHMIELVKEQS